MLFAACVVDYYLVDRGRWDVSADYGRNLFHFDVFNSANVTLGAASPTEFYAGTLKFAQSTTNLDLFRELTGVSLPVRVGVGAEFPIADEGAGLRDLPSIKGNVDCTSLLCEGTEEALGATFESYMTGEKDSYGYWAARSTDMPLPFRRN